MDLEGFDSAEQVDTYNKVYCIEAENLRRQNEAIDRQMKEAKDGRLSPKHRR